MTEIMRNAFCEVKEEESVKTCIQLFASCVKCFVTLTEIRRYSRFVLLAVDNKKL